MPRSLRARAAGRCPSLAISSNTGRKASARSSASAWSSRPGIEERLCRRGDHHLGAFDPAVKPATAPCRFLHDEDHHPFFTRSADLDKALSVSFCAAFLAGLMHLHHYCPVYSLCEDGHLMQFAPRLWPQPRHAADIHQLPPFFFFEFFFATLTLTAPNVCGRTRGIQICRPWLDSAASTPPPPRACCRAVATVQDSNLLRTLESGRDNDPGIGLTGHPSTMIDDLIDLTTMQPSKVLRTRFTPTDVMWIVVVGGVPYLAREAFRYLFPGRPTVVDQLKVLAELIAAAGEAKAKSLKVRISTAAKTRWEMPESIQEANVLGENADTIDLEIVFAWASTRVGHSR